MVSSSYAIGWVVALAFTMGAAAGGSVELLYWQLKITQLRTQLQRERQLAAEMRKMIIRQKRSR